MQRIFKGRHAATIAAAVQQTNVQCSVAEVIVRKGKKRARRVVVDAPDTTMAILRLSLSDSNPIGGW
ncbi:hypothetical protein BJG93_36560 (plasmid) [Paraburkholderia sprentiae WSM5005]|uniref:Uncharacterized protein n=1 Tax=Paraburkholderia sprentiae WSM5005 TaxID=754502 RepID=A0A8F4KII9_9BURK|nr:hypothetical protein [Paraburkholderia sprentiae]QXE07360.1 hypothetical protein BJG93_36560 [Paraburkholderia sprentiae WSM5005]